MSALLAVETSGSLCSVALQVSGRWFEDTQNVDRLHNRVVLHSLERLVEKAGVRRDGFSAVAFGAGPASFTGVRIAAAVAQAVAFASDALVVPVRSSHALALAASRDARASTNDTRWLTVTRSRRDAYYLAGYRQLESKALERCLDDRLHQGELPREEFVWEGWIGAGDRPPWWPDDQRFLDAVVVTARIVGELAIAVLERDEGLPPAAAMPIYVAGDSPWRPSNG